MIKTYNPVSACTEICVVEATYMFGDTKVIVRQKVDQCVGYEALNFFINADSDWLGDKPYDFVEGELEYDAIRDSVTIATNDGSRAVIGGEYLKDYLVKVEIVDLEEK